MASFNYNSIPPPPPLYLVSASNPMEASVSSPAFRSTCQPNLRENICHQDFSSNDHSNYESATAASGQWHRRKRVITQYNYEDCSETHVEERVQSKRYNVVHFEDNQDVHETNSFPLNDGTADFEECFSDEDVMESDSDHDLDDLVPFSPSDLAQEQKQTNAERKRRRFENMIKKQMAKREARKRRRKRIAWKRKYDRALAAGATIQVTEEYEHYVMNSLVHRYKRESLKAQLNSLMTDKLYIPLAEADKDQLLKVPSVEELEEERLKKYELYGERFEEVMQREEEIRVSFTEGVTSMGEMVMWPVIPYNVSTYTKLNDTINMLEDANKRTSIEFQGCEKPKDGRGYHHYLK